MRLNTIDIENSCPDIHFYIDISLEFIDQLENNNNFTEFEQSSSSLDSLQVIVGKYVI